MLWSVIGGPGGYFGLMAHTDTCVCRFARPAVPLGEGLHRGAVPRRAVQSECAVCEAGAVVGPRAVRLKNL